MLEVFGLLFRGTNTFQLCLGITLIILSLKNIGVSNLRWILELERKGFHRKKYDIISSARNFLISHPRPNPFKNNRPEEGWIKVKEKFLSAFVMCLSYIQFYTSITFRSHSFCGNRIVRGVMSYLQFCVSLYIDFSTTSS